MKINYMLDPKIAGDKWLSLRIRDGWYTYVHEEQTVGGVAIIGYSRIGKDAWKFIGRFENTPPHNSGIKLSSLTGGITPDMSPEDTAVKEFKEEAGIVIEKSQLIFLGNAYTYKGSDTKHWLYAVDCTGLEIGELEPDGTKGEEDAYAAWITYDQLMDCTDPLALALYAKGRAKGLFY